MNEYEIARMDGENARKDGYGILQMPIYATKELETAWLVGWTVEDDAIRMNAPKVKEVFSPDAVRNLEQFQTGRVPVSKEMQESSFLYANGYMNVHIFTCANRGDGNHRANDADLGYLVPTVRGWICPYCDYTQDWAHDFMTKVRK